MALPVLPLQEHILRSTIATIDVATRELQFSEGASEQIIEGVNPVTRSWGITYKPLTLAERDTVVGFLLGKGASGKFSYRDGCVGALYAVRMVNASIEMTRRRGKYIVSCELVEQYPSESSP